MTADSTPRQITVLGSRTCEDTAVTRSRLAALGVPFDDLDIDADGSAAELVMRLNDGNRVTPTVVVGDAETWLAEPNVEQLGELVASAGHAVAEPRGRHLHGDVTARAIPLRPVVRGDGTALSLAPFRSRRQVGLLLAHGAECLACFGYARQLAARQTAFDEVESTVVVAVSGSAASVEAWRHGIPDTAVELAADPDAAWKHEIARALAFERDEVVLLLLDRYLAPRVVSTAREAGGLMDPTGAIEWLRYLTLECPECAGEIEWGADGDG